MVLAAGDTPVRTLAAGGLGKVLIAPARLDANTIKDESAERTASELLGQGRLLPALVLRGLRSITGGVRIRFWRFAMASATTSIRRASSSHTPVAGLDRVRTHFEDDEAA